jgi:hypothetical protein
MGNSEGTQLHAQPAHDSFAESANYIWQKFVNLIFLCSKTCTRLMRKNVNEEFFKEK